MQPCRRPMPQWWSSHLACRAGCRRAQPVGPDLAQGARHQLGLDASAAGQQRGAGHPSHACTRLTPGGHWWGQAPPRTAIGPCCACANLPAAIGFCLPLLSRCTLKRPVPCMQCQQSRPPPSSSLHLSPRSQRQQAACQPQRASSSSCQVYPRIPLLMHMASSLIPCSSSRRPKRLLLLMGCGDCSRQMIQRMATCACLRCTPRHTTLPQQGD